MSPFIIPLSILFIFILAIFLYGFQKGGIEQMLENEINDNTIDATKRLETARFIDFFNQVKRVDSLYVNEKDYRIQYKKNNRLSDYLYISDIKIVELFFNGSSVESVKTFSGLPLNHETLEFDEGDLALMIDTGQTVLNIIFDEFTSYKQFVEYFKHEIV